MWCTATAPQVGLLALESGADPLVSQPFPLGDLVEGIITDRVGADVLVILTDVGVMTGFGTPEQDVVVSATAAELLAVDLPAGSMRELCPVNVNALET